MFTFTQTVKVSGNKWEFRHPAPLLSKGMLPAPGLNRIAPLCGPGPWKQTGGTPIVRLTLLVQINATGGQPGCCKVTKGVKRQRGTEVRVTLK